MAAVGRGSSVATTSDWFRRCTEVECARRRSCPQTARARRRPPLPRPRSPAAPQLLGQAARRRSRWDRSVGLVGGRHRGPEDPRVDQGLRGRGRLGDQVHRFVVGDGRNRGDQFRELPFEVESLLRKRFEGTVVLGRQRGRHDGCGVGCRVRDRRRTACRAVAPPVAGMPATSRPRVRPRAPTSASMSISASGADAVSSSGACTRACAFSAADGQRRQRRATTMAAGASAASVADAAGASAAAIAATAATTLLTRAGLAPNAAPPPENSPSKACWASRTVLNARRLSTGASRSSTRDDVAGDRCRRRSTEPVLHQRQQAAETMRVFLLVDRAPEQRRPGRAGRPGRSRSACRTGRCRPRAASAPAIHATTGDAGAASGRGRARARARP